MALHWDVVYGGKTPPPGRGRPARRTAVLGRTVGLGAQHVVAMFGATFVFPIVMGLNPNLAILMSGIATILFLLIVNGKVPSYLGTSASFVAAVAAIRAQGGDSADVTGSILVAGLVLAAVGVFVHFAGAAARAQGAAAGGHRRGRHADRLQPGPGRRQHLLAAGPVGRAAHHGRGRPDGGAAPGFWARIAIFLGLIFGYVISWLFDQVFGQINSVVRGATVATPSRTTGSAGPASRRRTGSGCRDVQGRRRPRGPGLPRADVLADLHPARAARRHRADRGEHRARQGGRPR